MAPILLYRYRFILAWKLAVDPGVLLMDELLRSKAQA
jgi:hypothetical protein